MEDGLAYAESGTDRRPLGRRQMSSAPGAGPERGGEKVVPSPSGQDPKEKDPKAKPPPPKTEKANDAFTLSDLDALLESAEGPAPPPLAPKPAGSPEGEVSFESLGDLLAGVELPKGTPPTSAQRRPARSEEHTSNSSHIQKSRMPSSA